MGLQATTISLDTLRKSLKDLRVDLPDGSVMPPTGLRAKAAAAALAA
jgi:hypothetical protein